MFLSLFQSGSNNKSSFSSSTRLPSSLRAVRSPKTIGTMIASTKLKTSTKAKQVRFCKVVQVVLIYSRVELHEANLLSVLFYSRDDYKVFHDDAVMEIDSFRFSQPCLARRNHLVDSGVLFDPQHVGEKKASSALKEQSVSETVTTTTTSQSSTVASECPSPEKKSFFGLSSKTGKSLQIPSTPSSPSSPFTLTLPITPARGIPLAVSPSPYASGYSFPIHGLQASPASECTVAVAAIILYQPFFSPKDEETFGDDICFFN